MADKMIMRTFSFIIRTFAFTSLLYASEPGGGSISRFVGVEYLGKAPEGIKYDASVGLTKGQLIGDIRFSMNRGHLGPHTVLWTHERADHGLHSRLKVIDIVGISPLSTGEIFMDRCFIAGSGNVYASGIMGTASKKGTVRAWGIVSKTGRIIALNPKQVECEQNGSYD